MLLYEQSRGMGSSGDGGRQTESGEKMPDTKPGLAAIIQTVEGMTPRLTKRKENMAKTTKTTKTTDIYLVTDSSNPNAPVAFSSIGPAFKYIQDTHEDLNPEGSALMIQTSQGLVPATLKGVKDRWGDARFVAGNADAADNVAKVASLLEGAVQACRDLGIASKNVAKVGELRETLKKAQANAAAAGIGGDGEGETLEISCTRLHKRGYKR